MSIRDQILTALTLVLAGIRVANGYQTDAGLRVWVNLEYQTAPPDKPCLILYPGDVSDSVDGDPPASLGEENHGLALSVEGFIADSESGAQAELLRQDILRALKLDPWCGGLADGFGAITSAARVENAGEEGLLGFVRIDFTINYATPYGES